MAFEQLTDNLKNLTNHTEDFTKNTAAYYKLSAFKYTMKAVTETVTLSMRSFLFLLFLLFFSVGFALLIGEHLESTSAGYFIVGGFYFVVFLLVFAFAKKPIERIILEKYSKIAFTEDANSEAEGIVSTQRLKHESIQ